MITVKAEALDKNVIDCNANRSVYNHSNLFELNAAPMIVKVNVNGIDVYFEIDTSTYSAVISKDIHDNYLANISIHSTSKELRTYDGKPLPPIGELKDVEVTFNKLIRKVQCFVLRGKGPALMGRQWLKQFNAWPLKIPNSSKIDVKTK